MMNGDQEERGGFCNEDQFVSRDEKALEWRRDVVFWEEGYGRQRETVGGKRSCV